MMSGVAGTHPDLLTLSFMPDTTISHLQHHRGKDLAGVAYLRRLERLHVLHPQRQVVNFGISTTIWDRLFGTFELTNEPATDYFFWSTIRSYWMKLTCKPSATS
jgi:sterol desaturase/sphingolipid hydroxylase (fatty acid hydroxylase superfamily)